jgi:hypothetical protein
VDPRAGLDDLEKRKFLTLPGLELRPLSCSVRSQSLYRLRYPGSVNSRSVVGIKKCCRPARGGRSNHVAVASVF